MYVVVSLIREERVVASRSASHMWTGSIAVRLSLLVALVASAVALANDAACAQETSTTALRVRVTGGELLGHLARGVVSFKGIPYAAPPTGPLRWRPPQPPVPWPGVRDADDYGPSCPQPPPLRHVAAESRAATTSEDCLTLNVWTHAKRASARPVMVWLHGGGNVAGTGSDRFVDGSAFARDGVVLVTLNYRLGVLGFFAHPSLAIDDAAGGNYGLLDQIAALRWVHDNISAFGGDPNNVTLFGESAGGEDTLLLAECGAAHGLFRRAIAESAGDAGIDLPTVGAAEAVGATLATELGLPGKDATAQQLRALSVDALVNVRDDARVGPIADGVVVFASPSARAEHISVPLVIGTNDGDGSLVGGYENYAGLFPQLSAADLAFVRARYAARGITSDGDVTQKLFGDGYFAAPARSIAAKVAASGGTAYVYRFDYVLSGLVGRRAAASHGSEIPFVFENWPLAETSVTDRSVGAALHACWIAFARTGMPKCASVPDWRAYDPHDGRIMIFGARPAFQKPDDDAVVRRLQRRLGGS